MNSRFAAALLLSGSWLLACDDDRTTISGEDGNGGGLVGTGGTGTTTGQGGSSTTGSGGETTTGSGGSTPTGGCGQAASDATETWVAKTVEVGGTTREWFVWLPTGYDPDTAYPVVYQFHGCSGSPNKENNNPPVQEQSGSDAIHVRGRAVGNCWDNSLNSADVAFFDALVATVEATWCADEERRFATGYSSGAFMTHRLACERGDVLRGVASIAGGLGGNNCNGKVAALMIHDLNDSMVEIETSEAARTRHLENNGCDANAATTPTAHAPCEAYAGCDVGYPVVWCQTIGQDHSRQDGLAAPAFWDFLAEL